MPTKLPVWLESRKNTSDMGVTTSKDRNITRYQLYEDASRIRVNALSLCRQPSPLQGAAHERSNSQGGLEHGHVPYRIDANRTPEDPAELSFEIHQAGVVDEDTNALQYTSRAHPAGHSESDHVHLLWISDPLARRKTCKTTYLRVAVCEEDTLSLSFDVSLLGDALRSSTLSLAYATSPEDLDRILSERKRGNVCLLQRMTYYRVRSPCVVRFSFNITRH